MYICNINITPMLDKLKWIEENNNMNKYICIMDTQNVT